mgnify:CR=1 FL=1
MNLSPYATLPLPSRIVFCSALVLFGCATPLVHGGIASWPLHLPLLGQSAGPALLADAATPHAALRQWIDREKAADGCRRVLRDVDTVEDHVGAALLAALGLSPPELEAPARVAVGDAVPVRAVVSPREDIPVRTRLRVEGEAADPHPEAGPGGWSTLRIRNSAQAGDRVKLLGEVLLGPEGRSVPVRTTRELTVVPPLEASLA